MRASLERVIMNKIQQSNSIRASHPANQNSISNRELVLGIGINNSDYVTQPTILGRKINCPCSLDWRNMLNRAYSKPYLNKKPTYQDVSVCSEWHSFMNFREWWSDKCVDGWHLDKDLLVYGNRVYHPDRCLYVPIWLNGFTASGLAARGELPIGVHLDNSAGKKKYRAACGGAGNGSRYIGRYHTPEEAHLAWREKKLESAAELRPKMDAIDERIYQNVCTIIENAR
jgi:hypothetical protein